MKKITTFRLIATVVFTVFIAFFGFTQSQTISYTLPGTNTIVFPPGVSSITVECWGAGGSGGSRSSTGVGGGGGGGAYSRSTITVTPGTTYSINVGAGSNSTAAGGDSWFINATTVMAKGGTSAPNNSLTGGTGGTAAASIGTVKFNGGNGRSGVGLVGGGGGSSAGTAANGTNATGQPGAVAPTGGGNGGNGTNVSNTNGFNGFAPGGGGGGCRRTSGTRYGGSGGNGMVKITYTKTPFEYTIYYENFDNNDGGWTSSTIGGRNGSWVRDTGPIVGQGSYFRTNTFNDFARNTGIYLTSPVISTTGFQDIHFSMDIRHDLDADTGDGVQVQYSLNGGSWTILNGTGGYFWYNTTSIGGLGSTAGWTGLNIENVNSPSKFIEASIPATVLNNATSVRFRVYFSDDNDTVHDDGVAIDNVVVRGNPITPFSDPTVGPGSINSDLKLWLKANTTSYSDGNSVTNWEDLAFDNDATSYGSFAPTFTNNATRNINFNPVIDFNRSASNHLKGKGGYWTNDYYVVIQTNSLFDKTINNSQYPISGKHTKDAMGQDGTGLGLGRISSRFNADALVSHLASTYAQTGDPGIDSYGRSYAPSATASMGTDVMILNVKSNTSGSTPVSEIYINGKKVDNHTGTVGTTGTGLDLLHTDFSNLIYNLGVGQFTLNGFFLNSYFDGKMSEVFSYSTPKTGLELNKINSYLALKNGVSLKAASSPLALTNNQSDANYYDSLGSVIWNATTNSSYNYDVAGIGRDDNSEFNQKQSKSSNLTNLLSVGLGDLYDTNSANPNTFANNRNYLIWGDNGADMNAAPSPITVNLGPTTVTTLSDVCNRNWKFIEYNGDMPEVKVSIPTSALTNLPALVGNDAYVMIVANDAAFTTGIETVFLNTNGANQECVYDFDGTKYVAFGVAHETVIPRHTTYDGVDNYIKIGNTNNLTTPYTIMVWVRNGGVNSTNTDRTVFSKTTGPDGYRLMVRHADNRLQYIVRTAGVSQVITSNSSLPVGEWHHVTITHDGYNTRLYVDGVNDNNNSLVQTVSNSGIFSIGAMYINKTTITNYFRGDIDELRIWNRELSDPEFRFIMNQEIEQFGTGTTGKIIPSTISKNDISTLDWNNLIAYYSMNSYIGTHLNDDSRFDNRGGLVIPNRFEIRDQTAPMPYISLANGSWTDNTVWTNGTSQTVPYSLSIVPTNPIPVSWNIVRMNHNITSTGNKTVLALFNESNTITASNDSKLEVTHFLRLNGKIDLEGESQLVQTEGSDLDPTSAGLLERDQDGTNDKFNYNYWTSPVGISNNTTNNNSYTVNSVLRDGTNPANPQNITWTNSINGSPTTPITLSNYWIYKFQNTSNSYANWTQIKQNGSLNAGQGFTMKGSGATSSSQNYTFVGKPHNADVSFTMSPNLINLTGNPYSSALDANDFINENLTKMTGTLYFWEHWGGGSHNLGAYQGGYATYNLTGGVEALAHPMVSSVGAGTKEPKRFIPVAQGFFIKGNATGGTITFKNAHRDFQKESGGNSVFARNNGGDENAQDDAHFNNNSNDPIDNDAEYRKLKLSYTSANGYNRRILVGFMNELATSDIDPGYDALHIDNQVNDMYFKKGTNKVAILGESYFEPSAIYPLEIKNSVAGDVTFGVVYAENFPANENIFIYDNVSNTYNEVRNQNYVVNVGTGTIENRFSLVFTAENAGTLASGDFNIEQSLNIYYSNAANSLNINNSKREVEIKGIKIYNIIGQVIKTIDYKNDSQDIIELELSGVSTGAYIANIITDQGVVSKKFIVGN